MFKRTTTPKADPLKIVKQIEEQKGNRVKKIYLFTLSISAEEQKQFDDKLRDLINSISQND